MPPDAALEQALEGQSLARETDGSLVIPIMPSGGLAPDDLADLASRAAQHARESIAPSTRRAYENDWRDFAIWCEANALSALPTTPQIIGLYLTKRSETRRVSTLQRRIVSISKRHRERGLHLDLSHPAIRETFAGIKRALGVAQVKKAPLRRAELPDVLAALPSTLRGIRNRAILLVGFAAALRRSELVALDVADLEFSGQGVAITIRRSKTDQEGAGEVIGIPCGNRLCPVAALRQWLDTAQISEGAVFRRVIVRDGQPDTIDERLSDKAVARTVKRAVRVAGFDPATFSGHSLRRGFATSAGEAGVDLVALMEQTRHRSEAVARSYIERGNVFRNRAVQALDL
jgi:integrase